MSRTPPSQWLWLSLALLAAGCVDPQAELHANEVDAKGGARGVESAGGSERAADSLTATVASVPPDDARVAAPPPTPGTLDVPTTHARPDGQVGDLRAPTPTHERDIPMTNEAVAAPTRIAPSSIAYNRPKSVRYGERFDIELFIDLSGTDAAAQALAARRADNPRIVGDTTEVRAVTGADVEVVLRGTHAKIDALIDGGRHIDARTPARWRWSVQPEGTEPVELVLQVWQLDPTTRARLDPAVSAWEDHIVVEITGTQRLSVWVGENWEWAWTFIVGPLGAAGWTRYRKRPRPT